MQGHCVYGCTTHGNTEFFFLPVGADYDDPIDDLYEPPPSPPPRPMDKSRLVESPTAAPSREFASTVIRRAMDLYLASWQ